MKKTGERTEVGSSNKDIMKDKAQTRISVFESRVLLSVQIIISVAMVDVIIVFLVLGLRYDYFTGGWSTGVPGQGGITISGQSGVDIKHDLLGCLSIIVASIPIALPIVLNVTMALGAAKMAREYDAAVTNLAALQDISSMTILCSDKTGTLTTARITISQEEVYVPSPQRFTPEDVALYAVLASNRDKKEDAIDRSVVGYFDKIAGPNGRDKEKEYKKVRNVGFSPIYKRVVFEYEHPTDGKVTVAKGLPTKILNTADGEVDDADDQWVCKDEELIGPSIREKDFELSTKGYKTLGVSVKIGNGPWEYVGVLPMLDPPRHDTANTIRNLVNAGIKVKMITGDHLNIAKETARKIGMKQNIHPGKSTRVEVAS